MVTAVLTEAECGMSSNPSESENSGVANAATTLNPKCSVCGQDLMQFRTGGRLGCPLDYQVFAPTLSHFFETNQSASLHVGKWPKRGPSRFETLRWQAEIRQAIVTQNYELAAQLRDRLRERKNQRKRTDDT
jgi:protein arginine kinase activator